MNLLKNHALNKRDISIAFLLLIILFGFYGGSLLQLFTVHSAQESIGLFNIIHDTYIRRIITFSFYQAFLSAMLSVGFGLLVAHSLYYQTFIGKKLLIKLFSLSMVLPVLVAIFGLLGVYGKSGWLSWIIKTIGFDWHPNIYGLSGILIAHIFFNIPLSAKVFLTALHSIPSQQRKLASQLGVVNWQFIKLVEIPYLKQALPSLFVLIFMLCFTSFTVVLTLGGSPKYTTLEVAIYQAVVFDFELQLGASIALLQFLFCFSLFALSTYLSNHTETTSSTSQPFTLTLSKGYQWLHRFTLVTVILFICLPLTAVLAGAFDWQSWQASVNNPLLYKALFFSLTIALSAGLLSVAMSVLLLLGTRQLYWQGFHKLSQNLVNMGMLVLAIPTLVLAVGLFIWLRSVEVGTMGLFIIVVVCNALMGMPFALRLLVQPLNNNMIYYEKLCQSLGITGLSRFRLIEWQSLKRPLLSACALTIALSLGDFTAIAMFGNQDFTSLPHLLYQQLGNYHTGEAGITAFILLMLCALIFIFIEDAK